MWGFSKVYAEALQAGQVHLSGHTPDCHACAHADVGAGVGATSPTLPVLYVANQWYG